MNGQVAQLIGSTLQADRQTVAAVFGPRFQNMGGWRAFLRVRLNDNVTSLLRAPGDRWSVESFHALYIACWIHHPVEKGTYMVNLGGLTTAQQASIQAAHEKHCSSRKSSHLSGSGRSASKNWAFLNGYHELLVQYETTQGRPYLFLKAEGHTTGISGIGPHMQSWAHKRKHGVGLQASAALNTLAGSSPLIEGRAAENYAKGYGKLLKNVLNLGGKKVTAREMMKALFAKTGHPAPPNFHMTSTNQQLGVLLTQYCNAASLVGAGGIKFRAGNAITGDMIADLRKLAQTLQSDGAVHMVRVYREIRADPTEVDQSLTVFYNSPG